jgi:hypothetical protein
MKKKFYTVLLIFYIIIAGLFYFQINSESPHLLHYWHIDYCKKSCHKQIFSPKNIGLSVRFFAEYV